MIIGNGMLAQKFKDYEHNEEIIIFASGVSNSKESSQKAFKREETLLRATLKDIRSEKIIYFSTCSLYDTYFENSLYTKHKLRMEEILSELSNNYIIFRLPQVVGNNNKDQLLGFLHDSILNNKYFELYDIERNIIDISDVKQIIDYIIDNNLFNNRTLNIANEKNIKVVELVKKIENIVNEKANYLLVNISGSFNIDVKDISEVIKVLNIFNKNYEENTIRKYYE